MKNKTPRFQVPSKLLTILFTSFGFLIIYTNLQAPPTPTIPQSPPTKISAPTSQLQPIPHQYPSPDHRYLLTITSPLPYFEGIRNCPLSLIDQTSGPLKLKSLPNAIPCQLVEELETPFKTWIDNQTLLFEPQPGNLQLTLISTDQTYQHQYDSQQLFFTTLDHQAKYWLFKDLNANQLHVYDLQHTLLQTLPINPSELFIQALYDPLNQGFLIITQQNTSSPDGSPQILTSTLFYFIKIQTPPPFPQKLILQTPATEIFGQSCHPATLTSQLGTIELNGGCFQVPEQYTTPNAVITLTL